MKKNIIDDYKDLPRIKGCHYKDNLMILEYISRLIEKRQDQISKIGDLSIPEIEQELININRSMFNILNLDTNKNTKFEKVRDDVSSFSDKTFGKDREYTAPLYHLKEEIDEVIESGDITEFADCLLLLIDAFNKKYRQYHTNDLLDECLVKMEENRNREWVGPDKNGVFHHKKDIGNKTDKNSTSRYKKKIT